MCDSITINSTVALLFPKKKKEEQQTRLSNESFRRSSTASRTHVPERGSLKYFWRSRRASRGEICQLAINFRQSLARTHPSTCTHMAHISRVYLRSSCQVDAWKAKNSVSLISRAPCHRQNEISRDLEENSTCGSYFARHTDDGVRLPSMPSLM